MPSVLTVVLTGKRFSSTYRLSGIVLNRKRISTKKEVLLVLTGLCKTPQREREEEKRARDSEDEREREMMITAQYII